MRSGSVAGRSAERPVAGSLVAAPGHSSNMPEKVEKSVKRTFQPNTRRRARKHGFRARMRTRAGRSIIKARRLKGRTRLSA